MVERAALITGASSGIGLAIARALGEDGYGLTVSGRRPDKLEAAAEQLRSEGLEVHSMAAMMTEEEQIVALVESHRERYGRLDVLANNAGVGIGGSIEGFETKKLDMQLDVNLRSVYLTTRDCIPLLKKAGGEHRKALVVNTASIAGKMGQPWLAAYSATKADQAHQVRLLAAELGGHQIRVNGINPDGVVRGSGIFAGGWGASRAKVYGVQEEELGEFYAQRTLLKREVLPENVANAVFALCTADFSHTTGLHVPVDAGVAAAFLR